MRSVFFALASTVHTDLVQPVRRELKLYAQQNRMHLRALRIARRIAREHGRLAAARYQVRRGLQVAFAGF